MRHRKQKRTLDRASHQRRVLVRNLANALVRRERIITTRAKAQATRSFVEKLITIGKQPTLHHRRQLIQSLADAASAQKIVATLGPRYQTKPGGYTRLIKLSPRIGDRAERVVVEFIKGV